MESPHGIQKIIWLVGIPVFFCCCQSRVRETTTPDFSFLQNGDLICRKGNGYFSSRFRDFSEKEKRYSHVGIVLKTADSVFVVHAEASEMTGIGFVKKEPAATFLENIKLWAAYRVQTDTTCRNRIAATAIRFYLAKTPFDLNFDLADSSAVYCTELAALCVNGALADVIIAAGTKKNGRQFIAVDDTYHSEKMELIYRMPSKELNLKKGSNSGDQNPLQKRGVAEKPYE